MTQDIRSRITEVLSDGSALTTQQVYESGLENGWNWGFDAVGLALRLMNRDGILYYHQDTAAYNLMGAHKVQARTLKDIAAKHVNPPATSPPKKKVVKKKVAKKKPQESKMQDISEEQAHKLEIGLEKSIYEDVHKDPDPFQVLDDTQEPDGYADLKKELDMFREKMSGMIAADCIRNPQLKAKTLRSLADFIGENFGDGVSQGRYEKILLELADEIMRMREYGN